LGAGPAKVPEWEGSESFDYPTRPRLVVWTGTVATVFTNVREAGRRKSRTKLLPARRRLYRCLWCPML